MGVGEGLAAQVSQALRPPSYLGTSKPRARQGISRAIPTAVQTAARQIRTIATVQSKLNSRKADAQAGEDRRPLQLRERLAKFGLELHPEKTRLIEFGRFATENRKKRGEGKPE